VRREVGRDDPQLVDLARRDVGAQLTGATRAFQGLAGSLLECFGVVRRGTPVDEPAADEPERILPVVIDGVLREHEPGSGMRRLERATEPLEDHTQPAEPAP
jgi:hypothetical protein